MGFRKLTFEIIREMKTLRNSGLSYQQIAYHLHAWNKLDISTSNIQYWLNSKSRNKHKKHAKEWMNKNKKHVNEYRNKHREEILKYHKNYYNLHKQKLLKQMKEWFKKHPEKNIYDKKYREEHKKECNEWARNYYKERKDRRFKYKIRGFAFIHKNEIFQRDNYTCQKCGSKEDLELHHNKYTHNLNDVITICKKCHLKLRPKKMRKEINMEEEKTLELNDVVATERKIGRPRKENKCVVVPISMPSELVEKIKKKMEEKGNKNRSDFICMALNIYLNSEEASKYIE